MSDGIVCSRCIHDVGGDRGVGINCDCVNNLIRRTRAEEQERFKLGPYSPGRPQIITLCGSTRFTREMMGEAWRLTKAGNIVIHWNIIEGPGSHGAEQEGDDVKKIIDDLYLHKVALADEVRILNVGGYVGESTRKELAHARKLGRPVTWLESERIPEDLKEIH